MGDILANTTIAAGYTAHQDLIFVVKCKRETVYLQFGDIVESAALSQPAATLIKGTQLIDVVAVVERKHGPAMHDFRKAFSRSSANALSGTVRCYLIRMLLLEFLQLLEQQVIVGV